MSRSRTLYVLGTLLACSGCLVVFGRGSVERSDADGLEVERVVTSPMKAFFADGSTAVFAQGGEITQDSIVGRATVFRSETDLETLVIRAKDTLRLGAWTFQHVKEGEDWNIPGTVADHLRTALLTFREKAEEVSREEPAVPA